MSTSPRRGFASTDPTPTASATASSGVAAQTPPPAPSEKEPDDIALTKLLIGGWESKEFLVNSWWDQKTSYAQSHTFGGIGTFVGVGTVKNSFFAMPFHLSGVWQIRNKKVYFEIQKSDIPDMIPEGLKGASTIIRLTNDEFVFQDSVLGITRTWNRQEAADN